MYRRIENRRVKKHMWDIVYKQYEQISDRWLIFLFGFVSGQHVGNTYWQTVNVCTYPAEMKKHRRRLIFLFYLVYYYYYYCYFTVWICIWIGHMHGVLLLLTYCLFMCDIELYIVAIRSGFFVCVKHKSLKKSFQVFSFHLQWFYLCLSSIALILLSSFC